MARKRHWLVAEDQHGVVTLSNEHGRNLLSAESGLPSKEFNSNVRLMAAVPVLADALQAIQGLIEQTYAHDENGNRTNGDCPISAADIVELLAEQECMVAEALATAGVQNGS